jgi:pimeloyl-ACP methyl ester carboxylesterase
MPKQHIKINIKGQPLEAIKIFNQAEGVPLLVIGPASIYMESLRLENICCLYGVDNYWTKKAHIPNKAIDAPENGKLLSPTEMAHNIEAYRQALLDAGEPVEKIVVLGPSAVGLNAAKYAELYPDHAAAVIMLNCPLGFTGLEQAQKKFLEENYNGTKYPGEQIKTEASLSLWKEHRRRCEIYKEKIFKNPESQYMAELWKDEIKYYQDPKKAREMYDKWPEFNIHMREHFFKEITKLDTSFLKKVKCPVLNTLGIADGIIPFSFVTETQADLEPPKYTKHIFASAHMPPLEDDSFPEIIDAWFKENNIPSVQIQEFSSTTMSKL